MRHFLLSSLLTLCCAFVHGQVGLLNECTNNNGFVVSNTISCTIAGLHANSLIVVVGFSCQASGSSCSNFAYTTSQTVSDTAGLTWTQRYHLQVNTCCNAWTVGDESLNDAQSGAFSGSDTFTVTFGASQFSFLVVYEFSHILTAGFFNAKNFLQTASICGLPGNNLLVTVSPTGAAPTTATWTINIGCFQDAGAIGMVVAYNTTLGTKFLFAKGTGGNFSVLQPPFTQLDGNTDGVGYLEIPASGKTRNHAYVF